MTNSEVLMNLLNTAALGAGVYFLKEKLALEGQKTRNDTSSPDQVERLDKKVVELKSQVDALNHKVQKLIIQDDRGPKRDPAV